MNVFIEVLGSKIDIPLFGKYLGNKTIESNNKFVYFASLLTSDELASCIEKGAKEIKRILDEHNMPLKLKTNRTFFKNDDEYLIDVLNLKSWFNEI